MRNNIAAIQESLLCRATLTLNKKRLSVTSSENKQQTPQQKLTTVTSNSS
ncbi:hypothetical protein [Cognaticolwellia aestuarii]|nr:hypothetical protein [Cognaticolwellia aestuarii]